MPFTLRRDQHDGQEILVVCFAPEQTLIQAEACRAELLEALDSRVGLIMDASAVAVVDLTFLQILTSLHRTAKQRGVDLCWADRPMPCLRQAAAQMGFLAISPDQPADALFWQGCSR